MPNRVKSLFQDSKDENRVQESDDHLSLGISESVNSLLKHRKCENSPHIFVSSLELQVLRVVKKAVNQTDKVLKTTARSFLHQKLGTGRNRCSEYKMQENELTLILGMKYIFSLDRLERKFYLYPFRIR